MAGAICGKSDVDHRRETTPPGCRPPATADGNRSTSRSAYKSRTRSLGPRRRIRNAREGSELRLSASASNAVPEAAQPVSGCSDRQPVPVQPPGSVPDQPVFRRRLGRPRKNPLPDAAPPRRAAPSPCPPAASTARPSRPAAPLVRERPQLRALRRNTL